MRSHYRHPRERWEAVARGSSPPESPEGEGEGEGQQTLAIRIRQGDVYAVLEHFEAN
jgi:hypothetical protein